MPIRLTKEGLAEYNIEKTIQNKIKYWEEKLPKLKFDKDGRAVIGNSNTFFSVEEINIIVYGVCDKDIIHAFTEYLEKNSRKLLLNANSSLGITHSQLNFLENSFVDNKNIKNTDDVLNDTAINTLNFLYNSIRYSLEEYPHYLHFINKYTKPVKIKLSKVLSSVYDIWLTTTPTGLKYADLIKECKKARGIKDVDSLCSLTRHKKQIELNNIYCIYQNINNSKKASELILSVNPLDLLSSSGEQDSLLTQFHSCWSLHFYIENDEEKDFYVVDRDGEYSNPHLQLLLGSILNRGMIYSRNNKSIYIADLKQSISGYVYRSHVWLDKNNNDNLSSSNLTKYSILVEKIYPVNGIAELQKSFRDSIKSIGATPYYDEEISNTFAFTLQDYEGINKFCKAVDSTDLTLYLDKVAFDYYDNNKLTYLEQYRRDYDDTDNGIYIPSFDDDDSTICSWCNEAFNHEPYYLNGEALCEYCYDNETSSCDHCDSREYNNDLYEAISLDSNGSPYYEKVCKDCLDSYYEECDKCGSYYYYNDLVDNYKQYEHICTSCKEEIEESLTECDSCGELNESFDLSGVDGQFLCSNCIDSSTFTCHTCNSVHINENEHTIYVIEKDELAQKSICKKCLLAYNKCDHINLLSNNQPLILYNSTLICMDCFTKLDMQIDNSNILNTQTEESEALIV